MSFNDPQNEDNPKAGESAVASWGNTVRDNQELFANRPRWVVELAQTVQATSGPWKQIPWTSADIDDSDYFHNPSANPQNFKIPVGLGGYYLLIFQGGFDSNSTGERGLAISSSAGGDWQNIQPAGGYDRLQISVMVNLVPGDIVDCWFFQSSTLLKEAVMCRFSGMWMGF